jgi:hypothetical protein
MPNLNEADVFSRQDAIDEARFAAEDYPDLSFIPVCLDEADDDWIVEVRGKSGAVIRYLGP